MILDLLWFLIRSERVYKLDRSQHRRLRYRWHTGVLQESKRSQIWILISRQANQHTTLRKLLNTSDKTWTLLESLLKLLPITERHSDSRKLTSFSRHNFDPADKLVPGHLPCFTIISGGAKLRHLSFAALLILEIVQQNELQTSQKLRATSFDLVNF